MGDQLKRGLSALAVGFCLIGSCVSIFIWAERSTEARERLIEKEDPNPATRGPGPTCMYPHCNRPAVVAVTRTGGGTVSYRCRHHADVSSDIAMIIPLIMGMVGLVFAGIGVVSLVSSGAKHFGRRLSV